MITVYRVWSAAEPERSMPWPSPYEGHALMYAQAYLRVRSGNPVDWGGSQVYLQKYQTDDLPNQAIRVFHPPTWNVIKMKPAARRPKIVYRQVTNLRDHPRYPHPNIPALFKNEPDPYEWRGHAMIDGKVWEVGGGPLGPEIHKNLRRGTGMLWIALHPVENSCCESECESKSKI